MKKRFKSSGQVMGAINSLCEVFRMKKSPEIEEQEGRILGPTFLPQDRRASTSGTFVDSSTA